MAEFVGKGWGALNTVLGSIGAAGATGVLGNFLGGNNGCKDDHYVNRYELGQESAIAKLESENSLLKSNIYGDQKMLELYKYFDGEIKNIRAVVGEQAVTNAKIEGTFAVLGEKISAQRNEFMCALNREKDERCCGDNAIVNYANATFYPKMVADVTVGTTTTAQATYNPLPRCGCCN